MEDVIVSEGVEGEREGDIAEGVSNERNWVVRI